MNLGDILVAKGLVSAADINRALEHQRENGGRLGGNLVALGLLTKEQIDRVLEEAPQAPLTAGPYGPYGALRGRHIKSPLALRPCLTGTPYQIPLTALRGRHIKSRNSVSPPGDGTRD
jgi:hypothetical protein